MRLAPLFAVFGLSGCLSYQEYLNQKADKYCDVFAACNTGGQDCTIPEETALFDTGCEFDAGMARDCLNGSWTCNTDVSGFEYPSLPLACDGVCR